MTDDSLKYVIHSTDGRGDFVTLPRKFIQGCQMEPKAFEELFFTMCESDKSYQKAYNDAEDVHIKIFGKPKYSDYSSFKFAKHKRGK